MDELFAGAAAHGATVLSAAARAYVDLNRDPTELDPKCSTNDRRTARITISARVQAGLGAIPRISGDGQNIYRRKLSLSEAERRMASVHRPYHALLANLMAEIKEQFGCAVLIDCHSMPSNVTRGAHAPDIVLGDRFGASCHPSVTALAEATAAAFGLSRVARNAPFAGGHITQTYGRPTTRMHALQIEINRALYIDERTLERSNGYARIRADMSRLAEALSAAAS